MHLLWPQFLLLLGALPPILMAYLWMLRRRRPALRYSSLSLIRPALPRFSRLRRHLPFGLLFLALGSLIVALGRPVRRVTVPSGRATIILAIDVSGSMRQDDIQPSRLRAAQAAALQFIRRQASTTDIAVVAFAGYAELLQPPTSDQAALERAVMGLTFARGTAIGSGMLRSIDVIAAIDGRVAPSVTEAAPAPGSEPEPGPPGAYVPHIIVVLTDGVTTTGPPPLEAAKQAVARGVRVYTIGFGTRQGETHFGGDPFGGQGSGSPFRRGIDEATLIQVAELTGGAYYAAASADELQQVFADLPTSLITTTEVMEITVVFTTLGALLVAAALGLALRWNPVP